MYDELTTSSKASRQYATMLQTRLSATEEAKRLVVERVLSTPIVDRLVAPDAMTIIVVEGKNYARLKVEYAGGALPVTGVHPHALRQIAAVIGLPMPFVTKQVATEERWRHDLVAYNFNELLHRGTYLDRKRNKAKMLHRTVYGELRGFLSRTFNRKLSVANLLRPFLETSTECGMQIIETGVSDVMTVVKCMLPYVFEPVDGEFVAFGVAYANSDFGAGKQRVSNIFMRIGSNTVGILEDTLAQVHLGALIEESDLELSEETYDKELAAYQSAVCDAVRAAASPQVIASLIASIQAAVELELPWHLLSKRLLQTLTKKEVELMRTMLDGESDIIDLPPVIQDDKRGATATAWWAANALGKVAELVPEQDRKKEIQTLAGDLLTPGKKKPKKAQ